MVDRKATTTWEGDLFSGKGSVTFDSSNAAGPLDVSWPARTEAPQGMTSPEELLAAAHSACYSMSLSNVLAKAGTPPNRLDTSAVATAEKGEKGLGITRIALTVRGEVPGIDAVGFEAAAQTAKDACPVSKLFAGNADITVQAELA
jgi:osmotically inducible protein OsmC